MSIVSGRTRWMLAAGGAVVGVAAVTGAIAAAAVAPAPPSYDMAAAPPAFVTGGSTAAASVPGASPSVAPSVALPADPQAEPVERKPIGDVIRSGMRAEKGEWVFYAVPLTSEVPGATFGVMAGRRLPTGEIIGTVVVNETSGSDRSPGFHAVEGAMDVDGEPTPAFGYYAGPAARITATVKGRTVTARQAAWSRDRSIVIFWFDLKDVRAKATHSKKDAGDTSGIPDSLKAFDRAGKTLPVGDTTVAVG
jgi:hypothetical protein